MNWTLLGQILAPMLAALAIGAGMGWMTARFGAESTTHDPMLVEELATREAALIEDLAAARDDLRAHAVELADANAEITCLLDDLHEARSRPPDPGQAQLGAGVGLTGLSDDDRDNRGGPRLS